jgi:cystathionine gamma-synthase
MMIAQHFLRHRAIESVLYPGLPSHPGHEIALRQMKGGFGGMLSLRMRSAEAAIAAAAQMKLWKRATSLGGVESLVEHRSSIEGAGSPCPEDLLRLSVGLENPEDLIADLENALAAGSDASRRMNGKGNGRQLARA